MPGSPARWRRSRSRLRTPPPPLSREPRPARPRTSTQEEVGEDRDGADHHADDEEKRMSKLRTCDSSWAMTPCSSSRSSFSSRPVVMARGVLRIAARGEGVGRGVVDGVDPRHRHVGRERQLPDDVHQLGRSRLVTSRAPRPRDQLVAGEVGPDAGSPRRAPRPRQPRHHPRGRRRRRSRSRSRAGPEADDESRQQERVRRLAEIWS